MGPLRGGGGWRVSIWRLGTVFFFAFSCLFSAFSSTYFVSIPTVLALFGAGLQHTPSPANSLVGHASCFGSCRWAGGLSSVPFSLTRLSNLGRDDGVAKPHSHDPPLPSPTFPAAAADGLAMAEPSPVPPGHLRLGGDDAPGVAVTAESRHKVPLLPQPQCPLSLRHPNRFGLLFPWPFSTPLFLSELPS